MCRIEPASGRLFTSPVSLDELIHTALLLLVVREPDKLEPIGTSGWDDLFSIHHQGCLCSCLSIVLDRFQHRYCLHGIGGGNGLHRMVYLALLLAEVRLASLCVIVGRSKTNDPPDV